MRMAAPDALVMWMLSWIEQRDELAGKLLTLAGELESLDEKRNAGGTSSTASTFLNGAMTALSLDGKGAPSVGRGPPISEITERFSSCKTMLDAQEMEEKSNNITESIQEVFEEWRAEGMEVSPSADPDEVDRHIMTDLMGAMANRLGQGQQLEVQTFEYESGFFDAAPDMTQDSLPISSPMTVGLLGLLAFFSLNTVGERFKFLIAEGARRLIDTSPEFKTTLKEEAKVAGGAVGMAFDLPQAIDNWKDLIKEDHVTEASQSLRDTADDISKINCMLRELFDNINKRLETLADVKRCIENSYRSAEDREKIIRWVIQRCNDEDVREWLEQHIESEYFFELVDMYNFLHAELSEKLSSGHNIMDIIIVAHGEIEEELIPSQCLNPLHTVTDVLLYSPWNCLLDVDAAYGIAVGSFQPQHRHFFCKHKGCPLPETLNTPTNLPNGWNSMNSARRWWIPNISLTYIDPTDDPVWKKYLYLEETCGSPDRHRIVIPLREHPNITPRTIPFVAVMVALSAKLYFSKFNITVHLAACLGRACGANPSVEHMTYQYARTIDHTGMTSTQDMNVDRCSELYRALRQVFGSYSSCG